MSHHSEQVFFSPSIVNKNNKHDVRKSLKPVIQALPHLAAAGRICVSAQT